MTFALVLVAAAFLLLLSLAAMKPDHFRVARSTAIAAPPATVFALIDDFHHWAAWSPWEKLDPALERSHSGAVAGTGAVYAWKGNRQAGQGRMEITESVPPSRLVIRIDFIKPMQASNLVTFTLDGAVEATQVTWEMRGPANFVSRIFQVFFSMDRMVGKDFERGLAKLKAVAEAAAPAGGTVAQSSRSA